MSEFLTLLPPSDALNILLDQVKPLAQIEEIRSQDALHRTLAEDIIAPISLPTFPRSTVDGFAVRAADTHGASENLPAYLRQIGEVLMGGKADFRIGKRQCGIIHTGGMLPEGADAVVMVEFTESGKGKGESGKEVEVRRAVGVGENVLKVGEDVKAGEVVMEKGIELDAAEIGALMSLGIIHISVSKKPKIGILSSGDEVIPPDQALGDGQIYDINSYSLAALIEKAGGIPKTYPIIPDEADAFASVASIALAENDMLIFTAGSSVSVRDLTASTIENLGAPGVLLHGVNVRPGKPTILAVCEKKPVIGLPGNPVSALVIARLFVKPTVQKLLNQTRPRPEPAVSAKLGVNLASVSGREDWVAVKLENGVAEPVFAKSNLIFSLVRADGLVKISATANGLAAGERVEVVLL